ncbi:MAG: S1 RNA-binding domain-containing protein [Lachnospiraceae bacterium]|nr:S1 RNA-binding domain-containing protein [Lachnospiraceae bacterium]
MAEETILEPIETKSATESVVEEPTESMDDYKAELEASFRKLSVGDIITGTVIAVDEEEVTLDLRYFAPGIIKAEEISNDPDFNILESVQVGDTMEATIIRLDDGQGNLLLSQKEANDVLAWGRLQTLMEEETVMTVRIKGIVPSGVIAYVEGIRGFIPASHLSLDYVDDCNPWLGKDVDVRVITVDESQKKLVLSAKVVAKEKEIDKRNHRISMLVPGTVMEGTVESLMPYGAFINLGNGLTGLVHISQICTRRIKKPSEVLEVGQTVKAKLLNTNDNKISLSIRALEEEMIDTEAQELEQSVEEYVSNETASTSLGDLLAKLKL